MRPTQCTLQGLGMAGSGEDHFTELENAGPVKGGPKSHDVHFTQKALVRNVSPTQVHNHLYG